MARKRKAEVVPEKGSGDKLARGAASASYGMPKVSQEKWESIFGPAETGKKRKKHYFKVF